MRFAIISKFSWLPIEVHTLDGKFKYIWFQKYVIIQKEIFGLCWTTEKVLSMKDAVQYLLER